MALGEPGVKRIESFKPIFNQVEPIFDHCHVHYTVCELEAEVVQTQFKA